MNVPLTTGVWAGHHLLAWCRCEASHVGVAEQEHGNCHKAAAAGGSAARHQQSAVLAASDNSAGVSHTSMLHVVCKTGVQRVAHITVMRKHLQSRNWHQCLLQHTAARAACNCVPYAARATSNRSHHNSPVHTRPSVCIAHDTTALHHHLIQASTLALSSLPMQQYDQIRQPNGTARQRLWRTQCSSSAARRL